MAAVSKPSTAITQKHTAHIDHVLNEVWIPTGLSGLLIESILEPVVEGSQGRSSPAISPWIADVKQATLLQSRGSHGVIKAKKGTIGLKKSHWGKTRNAREQNGAKGALRLGHLLVRLFRETA